MASQSGAIPVGAHVLEWLAEYFSQALPASDEHTIEGHLLQCAKCRSEYDELGAAALLLTVMPPGMADEDDGPEGRLV